MKLNLAAKKSTLPPQSLIVWRSQSSGLFWCVAWTWCHVMAALTSRMYLPGNVDHMSTFCFCCFCVVQVSILMSDAVPSSRQEAISSWSQSVFLDVPIQASVRPEVKADAGSETYSNAYQSQRLKTKQQQQSLGYALRYSYFQCLFVRVDSLNRKLASVHVCQAA